MRPVIAIFYIILPLLSLSQDPVQLTVHVHRLSGQQYSLKLDFSIAKGWHVYAASDSSLALDGLSTSFNDDRVVAFDLVDAKKNTVVAIHDPVFNGKLLSVYRQSFSLYRKLVAQVQNISSVVLSVKGFASNHKEFIPIDITKELLLDSQYSVANSYRLPTISVQSPAADCGSTNTASSKGFLTVFLLGFGGGLLALLTPCVFPMVPVTVSYFIGKAGEKKKALWQGLWYGAAIFFIYLLASLPFHLLGNLDPQIFNTISTNAGLNLFFFGVFVLFALSLFGWFEITLPAPLSNLTGSKSRLGSATGIFFMALTLAIVSFSCTGPILGSLLVGSISSASGAWSLTAGMAGFGLALGLPFALFASFPEWIKKMPKSGSWMKVVKISLAFLELALAIKFLSNADLVEHWGLLKREVFIGIWVLIFLTLSLYLFGIFKRKQSFQPSVSKLVLRAYRSKGLSAGRLLLGIICFLFTLYLTQGLIRTSHANLQLLSGFAPPLSYSIYGKENVEGKRLEPHVVNDYERAVWLSKQQNKPLLIDFTGWACVNCRKMEEQVWTNPQVEEIIKNKYIVVSLYVDDRAKLPAHRRFRYKAADGTEKDIITLGDKWATFQAENFAQVTQPLYVILSPEGKLMNHPVGYTPSVNRYKQWLDCGYAAFQSAKMISENKQ